MKAIEKYFLVVLFNTGYKFFMLHDVQQWFYIVNVTFDLVAQHIKCDHSIVHSNTCL